MKKSIIKWGLIILGGIIILLIFTNPSNKEYTEFLKSQGYNLEPWKTGDYSGGWNKQGIPLNINNYKPHWGKRYNFFIFSTYKYSDGNNIIFENGKDVKSIKNHLGVLSNFIELDNTSY